MLHVLLLDMLRVAVGVLGCGMLAFLFSFPLGRLTRWYFRRMCGVEFDFDTCLFLNFYSMWVALTVAVGGFWFTRMHARYIFVSPQRTLWLAAILYWTFALLYSGMHYLVIRRYIGTRVRRGDIWSASLCPHAVFLAVLGLMRVNQPLD